MNDGVPEALSVEIGNPVADVQLVSLRKVTQAQVLSRNLAQKMDEISQRLQKLTLQIADIDGQILAQKVTLEDRLAELTLGKSSALAANDSRAK